MPPTSSPGNDPAACCGRRPQGVTSTQRRIVFRVSDLAVRGSRLRIQVLPIESEWDIRQEPGSTIALSL
jgi:hypothetical protein